MGEFLITFISIIVVFFLGFGLSIMIAGRLVLNYLLTKMGRGKKILIWVDTPLGRRSFVGSIEGGIKEGAVSWKYNGSEKFTEILSCNVGRFYGVNFIALNVEQPTVAYDLTILGEIPRSKIDNTTFNNMLKRAISGQFFEIFEKLMKRSNIQLLLTGLCIILCIVILFKIGQVNSFIKMAMVI